MSARASVCQEAKVLRRRIAITGPTSCSARGSRVAGTSQVRGHGLDYLTIAYNAVTGARLWRAFYNGPASGADVAMAMTVSPAGGRVFVTGHSQGRGSGPDYATIAYTR